MIDLNVNPNLNVCELYYKIRYLHITYIYVYVDIFSDKGVLKEDSKELIFLNEIC